MQKAAFQVVDYVSSLVVSQIAVVEFCGIHQKVLSVHVILEQMKAYQDI